MTCPALDAGTSDAKDRTSGYGLRALFRVELPRDASGTAAQVKSLVTYGKGFALAGTAGLFVVYEKTDDKKEPFMHIKTFKQGTFVHVQMLAPVASGFTELNGHATVSPVCFRNMPSHACMRFCSMP